MRPDDFWDMTLRDGDAAIRGHYNREFRTSRERWNIFRHTVSMLLSPHLNKGQKLTPADVLKFPDEAKAAAQKKLSPEELQRKLDIIDRKKEFIPLSAKQIKNEFRKSKGTNRG